MIETWSDLLPQIERHVELDVDHIDLNDRMESPDSQMFQRIIDWLQ